MRRLTPAFRAAACLATALPASLVSAQTTAAQDAGAQDNWQRIVACAGEPSDTRRHACIDRVLDQAGVLAGQAERAAAAQAEDRSRFGLATAQPDTGRPSAPASAAPPAGATAQPPAASPAPLDEIATTVGRAFDPGNRLLVIVTAEGQIWQQSESRDIGLPPRAGTTFAVQRGALGGFTCRIAKGRSFRCRRQG